MTAALVALGLAALLLLRGLVLRLKEALLRRRLVPVDARILDPGQRGTVSEADRAWAANQAEDLRRAIGQDGTAQTNLPSVATPSFAARWEYVVEGRRYQGSAVLDRPVFTEAESRAGRAQVFYDRRDPAFSLVRAGDAAQALAWFIGAGVVGAVGGVMALLAAFDQSGAAP